MDVPSLPDNEGLRLRAEYETAARFYAWAVSELSRQRVGQPAPFSETIERLVLVETRHLDRPFLLGHLRVCSPSDCCVMRRNHGSTARGGGPDVANLVRRS